MSDFIFRLFCRWHHNLILSSCCNYGVSIPKEVFDPSKSSEEDDVRPADEVYYDALDSVEANSSQA